MLANLKKSLGERIAYYRKEKGLSQGDLGSALKVDKQTVWRWETGRNWPEYSALEKIANELEVKVERLFETIAGSSRMPTIKESLRVITSALNEPAPSRQQKRTEESPIFVSGSPEKLSILRRLAAIDEKKLPGVFGLNKLLLDRIESESSGSGASLNIETLAELVKKIAQDN